MHEAHEHFKKATAAEAMRLMDEEPLTLDEAFAKAKREFAGVTGYEAPNRNDHPAVAEPLDTD
jgi:hypothetical protein